MKSSHQAVVFFSRSPETEARKKSFGLRDRKIATGLARHMVTRTLRALQGLPADIYWASDVRIASAEIHRFGLAGNIRQEGASLRDRLVNVFDTLFHQGYDAVTVVGNDTELHRVDLKQALESPSDVVGPSRDGGFYLLKLQKNSPNAVMLSAARWAGGKPDVVSTDIALLPIRVDYDHWQTIVQWHPDPAVVRCALGAWFAGQSEPEDHFGITPFDHRAAFMRPPPSPSFLP